MSRTRIYWTDDERDLVIEAIAEHIRKKPRARYAELWGAGNAILAPDRQRKWYSSYSGAQNSDHVFFSEARKRAQVTDEFGKRPVEHVPHEAQPEVTWVPVPTPQTLSEAPFKDLLAEVAERILVMWAPVRTPAVIDALTTLQKTVTPASVVTPQVTLTRPVRVACCGLLPAQFNRVKERVNAKKVELVFVDKQYDPHQSDWRRGLDHVIVTRFVRHGHWDQARAALGNERVHWVSSGTETVVAKVSELVPGSLN